MDEGGTAVPLPSVASQAGPSAGPSIDASAASGNDTTAPAESDPAAIVPRLQSAVARVLPAIEATLARIGPEATHPRQLEQAGRALSALTRTLRELNTLLSEQQARAPAGRICDCDDDMPRDLDAFRFELARRIHAFVDARTEEAKGGAEPQGA
jgi:hypothetical protein